MFKLTIPQEKATKLITAVALAMCAYQLWITIWMPLEPIKLRTVHLAFVLTLTFLSFPATQKLKREKRLCLFDLALAALPIPTTVYLFADYERIADRIDLVSPLTRMDYVVYIAVILLVLEATRRTVGLALVVIAGLFLTYALVANRLPAPFGGRGYTLGRLVDQTAMNLSGIYGIPIGVASTYVFLFILFGAFLIQTGAGQNIIDIANALTGRYKGGPAKAAVISSMFFGTINGSSVANVITTGTFTIPMMKALGYKKDFAGAVEAVASTGGQIMPPIMGAAAFIMAELMGEPYLEICKAAIIPAVLYYLALLLMVHLEADKLNLPTMPANDFKRAGHILKSSVSLVLPVTALLYTLIAGYSPMRAGLMALATLFVIGLVQRENRLTPRTIMAGLVAGAKGSLIVSVTCATAGIVTGVVAGLGVGIKFTSSIFMLSSGNMTLALILVMLAVLVLGMGLPTTAAYIIAAAVSVPPLMQMGASKMSANFFAMYFACISSITPPVAVAAYAAAALSGASPMRTGFLASKLGISGFIVPFIFVYNPVLLMQGDYSDIALAVMTALVGITGISCALEGWIFTRQGALSRVVLAAGGLLLMYPGLVTDLLGAAAILPPLIISHRQRKALRREESESVISLTELERKASMEAIDGEALARINIDSDA